MTKFSSWYKNVTDSIKKNKSTFLKLENDFRIQSTHTGRVELLLKQDVFKESIQKSFSRKDTNKSKDARNLGNKHYAKMCLNDALYLYSKSITLAENHSNELALSYANRSAVLFEMKEFSLCQLDIKMAIVNNYPSTKVYKLYERLGKCLLELSVYDEATIAFKKCLEFLNDSDLSDSKKQLKKDSIFIVMEDCNDNFLCSPLEVQNAKYFVKAPVLLNPNPIYKAASESFKIVMSEMKGRYAIADKDIHAGDIIVVEKAFSSMCLPGSFDTHCYDCLTQFKINYPCRNCSMVNFCSTSCEEKCWSSFHQYECEYMNCLINDDVGLAHLALKMIVRVRLETLISFVEYSDAGFNNLGVYDPEDYGCIYSLVGNSKFCAESDLFRRTLLALYLGKMLATTGFVLPEENMQVVCSHLLKNILMLPCNAHEVSEFQLKGDNVQEGELKEIASAAFTTLSLLNHSCDPSVVRHCYGDTCVLRAIKHINAGDEIVDNYGFLYPVQEKIDRQKHLADQYYFECNCAPCNEEWPLYNTLPEYLPVFFCLKCGEVYIEGKCCGTVDSELSDFNLLHARFMAAMKNVLDSGDIVMNLLPLLNYIDLVSRRAKLPVIHLNNCQEVAKLCFSLQGNFARI